MAPSTILQAPRAVVAILPSSILCENRGDMRRLGWSPRGRAQQEPGAGAARRRSLGRGGAAQHRSQGGSAARRRRLGTSQATSQGRRRGVAQSQGKGRPGGGGGLRIRFRREFLYVFHVGLTHCLLGCTILGLSASFENGMNLGYPTGIRDTAKTDGKPFNRIPSRTRNRPPRIPSRYR
jgi:hypothetical protein